LREEDDEYNTLCEKEDQLSDLVIELSERQYELSVIYSKIKKLTTKDITRKRKQFTEAFIELKESIVRNNTEEFFILLNNWLLIYHNIAEIDDKISDLNGK